MKEIVIFFVILFFGTFLFINLHASNTKENRPFSTIAIVAGRCREVDIPVKSAKNLKWMYRLQSGEKGKDEAYEVGLLFLDRSGTASVCFDERGLAPFVEKNIRGQKVSISGYLILGNIYHLDHNEILLVESIKLLEK